MVDLIRAARILGKLTLARTRDFLGEPEAVFWVIVFPPLLAAILGVAFRDGPAQAQSIAVTTPALLQDLGGETLFDLAGPLMLLTAWGLTAFGLGAWLFRWR